MRMKKDKENKEEEEEEKRKNRKKRKAVQTFNLSWKKGRKTGLGGSVVEF